MTESIDKYIIPRFLLNEIYPYSEGIQLEFKKSFHINQHYKYRETICAFLNTQGGLIIYGIDECISSLQHHNEVTDAWLFIRACLRAYLSKQHTTSHMKRYRAIQ